MNPDKMLLSVSLALNASLVLAFIFKHDWNKACYWFGALMINASLIREY
jgi:hypothetical protein